MKRLFMYLSAGIIILASASCKTDSGRKESSSVLVKTLTAAVCADIEGFAVFLYFLHDFLGT